ncbi:MAG: glycosyltransferase [Spirochaetia bacterium]|jgi:cellulose synthase/poly-beta-1,6-N-acetylglucosamine synthase-like glycosyltransferase
MLTFLIVYAAYSAVILAFHLVLAAGLVRTIILDAGRRVGRTGIPLRQKQRHSSSPGLRAEVVVALRNEETTLPDLLESLQAQTSPDVTFLFVDDRSTDATGRLLDEFAAASGNRARVIHNVSEPQGLTGKQAALDLAFQACRGDVLLFTDGDCTVPPGWVEEMLACFCDPSVGVVLSRIELEPDGSFLQRFQAFEQPLLNQYNLGSAGVGLATGCFGNNIAVRAEAVKATGGFRALGYSVTEDAMLLDAVCRKAGWKPRAHVTFGSAARTVCKARWIDYVNQHTRWNAGGLFSEDPVTRFFYVFVVLIYLTASLVLLPLGFLDWRITVLSLTSFVSIGTLGAIGGFYQRKDRVRYFITFLPFLVFFAFFYVFITLRAFALRPFEWKGRVLRPHLQSKKTL